MTPCEKAGLKVGDKIRTLVETHCIRKGTVITLDSDDGSNMPYFTHDNGDSSPFTVTRQWERVMTQPTNKQEALDQIDALRAYIEDCDKPKPEKCMVYVRKSAKELSLASECGWDDELMDHMLGKVLTLHYVDNDGDFIVYSDTECDKSLAIPAKACVVVEGELPPNE